ncbi:MAG TPA: WD40 repeat domain-containing protein [Gemmataceae bacterium]|nr:WD40 repeat domain-containing protein [Gemmataceae bacterium]
MRSISLFVSFAALALAFPALAEARDFRVLETRIEKASTAQGSSRPSIRQIHFAADGASLLTIGEDGTVMRWDLRKEQATSLLPGKRRFRDGDRVSLSPNQRHLAVWDVPSIPLWDLTTGSKVRGIPIVEKRNRAYSVGRVVYSPDGKWLAGTVPDRVLVGVWDVSSGKEVSRLEGYARFRNAVDFYLPCLLFSPDSQVIAAPSPDRRSLWFHDARTGKFLQELSMKQPGMIYTLAFSRDGRMVAGGCQDNSLHIWERRTGGERIRFTDLRDTPKALAFDFSNRWLASASEDGMLRIWNVLSGERIRYLPDPKGALYCVQFSPDGRLLAAGGPKSTVFLWDMTKVLNNLKSRAEKFTVAELESLWADLQQSETERAYRAMARLVRSPQAAVSFLKTHQQPALTPHDAVVARLMRDLDSDQFAIREKAQTELLKLGERIEGALSRTLAQRPSLEIRRRVEDVLENLKVQKVRAARVVEVLEHIGNADARAFLAELARGASEAELTGEAKAALERLCRRRVSQR